jgi:hypothetical protein
MFTVGKCGEFSHVIKITHIYIYIYIVMPIYCYHIAKLNAEKDEAVVAGEVRTRCVVMLR